jgi:nicotinamidase/pyrazinamidase
MTRGFDAAASVLLVVDLQPDFMPGGPLPVREGDLLVGPVRSLVLSGRFGLIVATQDWHPPEHVSFASNHAGRHPFDVVDLYGHPQVLWPDHCLQGSDGAAIHRDLPLNRMAAIIRKGMDPKCDSYSAFRNNWDASGRRPQTGLAGYLRECGVRTVYICGLARDFCVKWSAEDASAAGFRTKVYWDLTRPVDYSSDDQVRSDLVGWGVEIIHSGYQAG